MTFPVSSGKITTFADLVCICGLQELLEKLDREKAILNAAASEVPKCPESFQTQTETYSKSAWSKFQH